MNVLFLDFDGVIRIPNHGDDPIMGCDFDLDIIHKLSEFCELYNFKIVISSDWRYDDNLISRWDMADVIDVLGEFIHHDWRTTIEEGSYEYRHQEISKWIDDHPETEHIIILDDLPELYEDAPSSINNSLVLCDSEIGLSEPKLSEMVNIITYV